MSFGAVPQPSNYDSGAAAVAAASASSQLPGSADPLLSAQAVNPFDIQAIVESLGSSVDSIPAPAVRLRALQQLYLGNDPWAASRDPRNAFSTVNSLFDFIRATAPTPERAQPLIGGTAVTLADMLEARTGVPTARSPTATRPLAEIAASPRVLRPTQYVALHSQPVNEPYVGHAAGGLTAYVDALHAGTANALLANLTPAHAMRPGESVEAYSARIDPFGILARHTFGDPSSRWVQRIAQLCREHVRQALLERIHPAQHAKRLLAGPNIAVEHADFLRAVEHYFARNPNAPRLPYDDDPPERNFSDIVAYMRDRHRAVNTRMHPLL